MVQKNDIPDFLRFVENAVTVDIGGVIPPEDTQLIQRTALASIDAQNGDMKRAHLLTMEIANLQNDPAHRPENALRLRIITATKRLCEDILAGAA
ncbi:MAG: hypothetical protein PHE68_03250 [Candidatus Peribacteraceae bacterium]|nr:hypothetical protein [Candidatus Peribacteraceae bacterium]MDD5074987.1 hypothetical protein [Candidatus Peribacteraceae bacterium]